MDEAYKVLIVDDEWIIRDGLKSFDWPSCGCRLVGDTEDGDEALLLSRAFTPDIVLADIKMPGMSGLEFARQLKQFSPGVEILFLTGYDRFDFAQEAMRIGAQEYLLKPTDFGELKSAIERMCARIAQRRRHQSLYADMREMFDKARPILMNKLAQDLLHGRFDSRESTEKTLKLFNVSLEKYIVISAQLEYDPQVEAETGLEAGPFEFGVKTLCESHFARSSECVLNEMDASNCAFILGYPANSSDEACLTLCAQTCQRIQAAMQERFGHTVSFGISEVGCDPYEMNRYYAQADGACRQKLFFDHDCVILYRDIARAQAENWTVRDSDRQLLMNAVAGGDAQRIRALVDRLAQEAAALKPDMDSLKIGVLDLELSALRCLSDRPKAPDAVSKLLYEGMEKVYGCDTADKLFAGAFDTLTALASLCGEAGVNYHQRTVRAILDYLSEHYREDLSLDTIAQSFSLSAAYIGKLLKKQTGKSFLEILTDARMDAARALMAEKKYKIYEIAEMVGYKDYSYFVSVFRKKYGITPKKYQISL